VAVDKNAVLVAMILLRKRDHSHENAAAFWPLGQRVP